MSHTPYPIRTERLLVRMLREEDVDVLTAYRNDPEVARLQDWDLPWPRERAERLVAAHADRRDVVPGTGTQLALDLDGELVGDLYVGLDEHCGVAELGFTLAAAHQGCGYGVEAVCAVVDDLVDRLGVHRLVAELSPDNLASARLLERVGMTFEHLAEKSFWWRGAWDDNLWYSMTADGRRAWRDRPRTPPQDVRLVELTHENAATYGRLRTHRTQERFVATMADSYTDALFPEPEGGHPVLPVLRGIEADGEPAGFLMYADGINEGTPEPYLWRFLVDRRHQGRGIGRRALQRWAADLRAAGHTVAVTSWVQDPGGPEPFYLQLGFVLTGERDEGEAVARLEL
ncbi:GNAT family N-acetyltransferase [Ornithinimicrobium avium]|uniref:GNAT family N-acetyltransferase n=1 Tax=Ornithinimicrobium avium TaxID=2283195 RepID=A0A345NQH6_9MICO|nr:GNAT family N-acetyltransferase [Ornithinimicrobium avium]AXH97284.1 GNAT family N-acetyltransferase [Ornithinimicrobium avium]